MTIVNSLSIGWCVIIVIIAKQLYGRWFNPCFLMNLIWCICSTCSTLGFFSFYKPSIKTLLYILTFQIVISSSLLLFCTLFNHIKIHKSESKQNGNLSSEVQFDVSIKLLGVFLAGSLLFILPSFLTSLSYVSIGDLITMRAMFLKNSTNYMGKITSYAYNYLIRPFYTFLDILAAYAMGINYRKKWKLLLLAVLGSVIHILYSGGRMLLFELIVYIIISLILFRPKRSEYVLAVRIGRIRIRFTKRAKVWLLVLFPAIGVIAYVTSFRLYSGQKILGTFWQYSVGPMLYLDTIICQPRLFGITPNNLTFGKMTFGFISGLLDTLASVLFGADYRGADYLASLYTEKFYPISPRVNLNATSTILYPFLRDWGSLGIIIGPVVIAFIIEFIYHMSATHKGSTTWNLLLISIYYMIAFSVWRYTLMLPTTYMSLIWILAIGYTVRVKSRRSSRKGADSLSGKINESS